MTWSRTGALKVASRAHRRLGVPWHIALYIAFAARKNKVKYAVAFALFEQESNYEVIYGHDAGGFLQGQRVTKANYKTFRDAVVRDEGRGSNGVGLGQITYWTYIRDHKGLWKPRVQVYLSLSILAELMRDLGEFNGIGAYNGGPANPVASYANEVLARAKAIRPKLKRKGSK